MPTGAAIVGISKANDCTAENLPLSSGQFFLRAQGWRRINACSPDNPTISNTLRTMDKADDVFDPIHRLLDAPPDISMPVLGLKFRKLGRTTSVLRPTGEIEVTAMGNVPTALLDGRELSRVEPAR